MFQIGSLAIFCGLLAQTIALPGLLPLPLPLPLDQGVPLAGAPDLTPALTPGLTPALTPAQVPGLDPTDLVGSLTSALSNGLLSGGLLGILEDLPLLDILKPGGHTSGGLLGGLLEKATSVLPLLSSILDIEITNPQLLELGLVQSANRHRLYVTIPLSMVLNVKTPLTGSLLRLAVRLNLTAELAAVTDKHGKIHLAIGDCTHSPGSLEISLLDGLPALPVQGFVNSLSGVLNNVLPDLVQGKVCSLLNNVLSQLDFTLAHAVIDKLIHGLEFVIKV